MPAGSKKSHEPVTVENQSEFRLPEEMEWHSGTVFTNLGPSWNVIFARDNAPVVVSRRFGLGSVVLATDSFFISNEALSKDRHADLLAWLIGSSSRVVFDESHFGMIESSGVATLIGRYHLTGFIAGLLCLAALFIWKNSARFGVVEESPTSPGVVTGKEAAAGFVNLLRRNMAPGEMLKICLAEWEKSHGSEKRFTQLKAAKDRDPIKSYKDLCALLGKLS